MGDLLTSAPDAVDGFSSNKEVPWMWMLLRPPRFGGAKHASVTTIGFDIAKSVFQIHGVDAAGNVIVRRQLKRHDGNIGSARQESLFGRMEAAIADAPARARRAAARPR
jgi:hypothetical protein